MLQTLLPKFLHPPLHFGHNLAPRHIKERAKNEANNFSKTIENLMKLKIINFDVTLKEKLRKVSIYLSRRRRKENSEIITVNRAALVRRRYWVGH